MKGAKKVREREEGKRGKKKRTEERRKKMWFLNPNIY